MQNWINSHNTWAGEQKTRIDSLSNTVEAYRNTINNLSGRVATVENWISDHNTWAGQQKTRIDNLSADITRHAGVINANTSNIEGHRNAINSLSSRAKLLEDWKAGHNTWAGEQKTRIDNLSADVNRHAGVINENTKNIENHRNAINSLSGRAKSLEDWKASHNTWAGEQKTRIDNLSADVNRHAGVINENTKNIENHRNAINSLSSRAVALETWKDTHNEWAGVQKARIDGLQTDITALKAADVAQALWNTNQSNRITKIENRNRTIANADLNDLIEYGEYYLTGSKLNGATQGNGFLEVIGVDKSLILQRYTEWSTGRTFERQFALSNPNRFSEWVETTANKSDIDSLKAKDVEITNMIKNETDARKAADIEINNKLVTINQAIDNLNVKIDSLNWSDLGIIAAVTASMKANTDLWTADHYDGASVGENDGKAVRLFKNQFQGLKSHLAGVLSYYFDMNDKDSAMYKLRYSIVAGFEETRILLADKLPKIIESQGTTNTYLSAILTWLELQDKHFKTLHSDLVVVTQWLSEIFKKPVPSITVPPIVIPPIVIPPVEISEEKNGWLRTLIETVGDVMKTAIETLGSVLETAIKELGKSLKDILTFLDGLLDDIIHLLVPENMDFFNDSVAGIKETSDTKIKPITDLTGKFLDALNVNDRSRRLRGTGAIFGTSLVDSLKFTIMGTEVDMTPDNSVLQGVAIVRRVISVFVIGYTGFAIKRRVRGKEGLIE